MAFFSRRRASSGPGDQARPGVRVTVPGLAAAAQGLGWEPLTDRPFGPGLHGAIHDTTRAMYGASRPMGYPGGIGETRYDDLFRWRGAGRTVVVANARTFVDPGLFQGGRPTPTVSVCAAELPTIFPRTCVQPHRVPLIASWPPTRTGDPAFDDQYRLMTGAPGIAQVFTAEVRQRLMARDDWVIWLDEYWLACVGRGGFASVDELRERIGDVLGLIQAIPESVMPRQVDHSADDLVARINQLDSVEDAMAFLLGLTPADRAVLARSNTPLAEFADVRTPAEAMARFEALDPARRMQLFAMFMRSSGNA